jgi:hypothetical protein
MASTEDHGSGAFIFEARISWTTADSLAGIEDGVILSESHDEEEV